MRTTVRVILSFVLGFIAAYAVTVATMIFASQGASDRDGGMAMAIMFAIGPLGGLIGGTAAAIAIPIWLGRRDQARVAAGIPDKPRWLAKTRAIIAAIAWGFGVYLLVRSLFWFFVYGQMSFTSYWAAFAVGFVPQALGVAAAAVAAFSVMRNARPPAA